ncbi:hypothetical protein B0O80DRAFT_448481 [Mortierella sp. GBAus27b]|nr:hypothetical protein BGX31_011025 [Mortierella sp. GBA43]KAI8355999.1 hypothetical protein B0O80DRAFT_448481 [Mortierella sp. GBAus27b]
MFDIPELDDIVFRQLRRSDLARCVRVSQKWHTAVIPYLWRDMTLPRCARNTAFCRLVAEDFLHELCKQQDRDQHTQPSLSPFSSCLEKYGHLIRKTPEPGKLLSCFRQTVQLEAKQSRAIGGRTKYPAPHELLRHFYKRCPIPIQVDSIHLTYKDFTTGLWRIIAEDVIIHVRHLSIHLPSRNNKVQSWMLERVLDRLSTKLERLSLQVDAEYRKDEVRKTEKTDWMSLKELNLMNYHGVSTPGSFWSWLWARCGRVERLEIDSMDGALTQDLADAMLTHMPHLDRIRLRNSWVEHLHLEDSQIATLLSGSRKGWKVVDVGGNWKFKKDAMRVLTRHFPTLEELIVDGCDYIAGKELVQVLSSCPNLRALVAINGEFYSKYVRFTRIDASVFNDRDPGTGLLKMWPCENSLRVLKIKLCCFTIPEVRVVNGVIEMNLNPERAIQELAYTRLARLTNLETLWLGHNPSVKSDCPRYQDQEYQFSCLEMSLKSGLDELSGLKELKELNVSDMYRNTEIEDVQWMVENWPKLETIYGLDEWMVLEWLESHYPTIKVPHARDRDMMGLL